MPQPASFSYVNTENQPFNSTAVVARGQQVLYFKHGQLYKIVGDQNNWYDPDYVIYDRKTYNMNSIADITSMHIPHFVFGNWMEGYGITGSLDYVVRMKAANLRNKGLIAESDECYRKSIELMRSSGVPYDMTPYLYLAKELLREGRFEESEKEENKIYAIFQTNRDRVNADPNVRPYITKEDREYYRIKYMLPSIAPKSISGYTKMKRSQSPNFLKIYEAASKAGIYIEL